MKGSSAFVVNFDKPGFVLVSPPQRCCPPVTSGCWMWKEISKQVSKHICQSLNINSVGTLCYLENEVPDRAWFTGLGEENTAILPRKRRLRVEIPFLATHSVDTVPSCIYFWVGILRNCYSRSGAVHGCYFILVCLTKLSWKTHGSGLCPHYMFFKPMRMENSVLSGAAQLTFADIEVQPLLIQHMMYFEEKYFQWFIFS